MGFPTFLRLARRHDSRSDTGNTNSDPAGGYARPLYGSMLTKRLVVAGLALAALVAIVAIAIVVFNVRLIALPPDKAPPRGHALVVYNPLGEGTPNGLAAGCASSSAESASSACTPAATVSRRRTIVLLRLPYADWLVPFAVPRQPVSPN